MKLSQRALSVGKRVHSETGIDAAGASVVSVALGMAEAAARRAGRPQGSRRRAGAMGALSAKHLPARSRAHHIVNRSLPRAKRLAENIRELGVAATPSLRHLRPCSPPRTSLCAVPVRCGPVVSLADVHRGLAHGQEPRQLVICDSGMPRDVDPAVAGLPGCGSSTWTRIQREPSARAAASGRRGGARDRRRRGRQLPGRTADGGGHPDCHRTAPAGRRRGRAELLRLDNRLPELDAAHRDEVAKTVRRVVDKLLHAPTVRVKQLASAPGGTATPRLCASCSSSTSRPSTPSLRGIALGGNRSRQDRVALD